MFREGCPKEVCTSVAPWPAELADQNIASRLLTVELSVYGTGFQSSGCFALCCLEPVPCLGYIVRCSIPLLPRRVIRKSRVTFSHCGQPIFRSLCTTGQVCSCDCGLVSNPIAMVHIGSGRGLMGVDGGKRYDIDS